MAQRPNLIILMAALQAVLIFFDLALPFLSPGFSNFGPSDYFVAYSFGVLDFFLVMGFLRGSKWAWLFGLLFSGLNIISYVYSYLSYPALIYVIPLLMRVVVMLCLRGKKVRQYFELGKPRGKPTPQKATKK